MAIADMQCLRFANSPKALGRHSVRQVETDRLQRQYASALGSWGDVHWENHCATTAGLSPVSAVHRRECSSALGARTGQC
eukprot:5341150-Amphidinium_carterae.1